MQAERLLPVILSTVVVILFGRFFFHAERITMGIEHVRLLNDLDFVPRQDSMEGVAVFANPILWGGS